MLSKFAELNIAENLAPIVQVLASKAKQNSGECSTPKRISCVHDSEVSSDRAQAQRPLALTILRPVSVVH